MTDSIPKPPWLTPDYEHDLQLAMLTRSSYLDRNEIEVRSKNPYVDRLFTVNWTISHYQNDNTKTGFVAYAFERKNAGPDPTVVIAIRGSDFENFKDWTGPNVALAADGELLALAGSPVSPKSETSRRQMAEMQKSVLPGWHPQFEQALDFALAIRNQYEVKGYTIEVTGHSLAGGEAQLLSHTFGWGGRTFDPAGAQNLIEAPQYQAWLKKHGITPAGVPVPDPDDLRKTSLVNYAVNDSPVSQMTGPHLGHVEPISALSGREGAADYARYAVSKAAGAVSEIPFAGDYIAARTGMRSGRLVDFALHGTGTGLDATERHAMDRIVRVFERAVETGKLPQWGQVEPDAPAERRGVAQSPALSGPGRGRHDDGQQSERADVAVSRQPTEAQPQEAAFTRQEYRFFSRTPEDGYVEAYLDAMERNDSAARQTLTQRYEQLPHVQAEQQAVREALEAERQRALEEQQRQQEQERQWLAQQQEQEQERSRSHGRSM